MFKLIFGRYVKSFGIFLEKKKRYQYICFCKNLYKKKTILQTPKESEHPGII